MQEMIAHQAAAQAEETWSHGDMESWSHGVIVTGQGVAHHDCFMIAGHRDRTGITATLERRAR